MLFNKHNLNCVKIADKGNVSRPELGSVFFSKDKTVSSDGVRLLEVSVPVDVKVEKWPKIDGLSAMRGFQPFMVDARMLAERVKLSRKPVVPILACVAVSHLEGNRAEFITSDGETASRAVVRRVEGTYPDYEKIIPTGKPMAEVTLNGKLLAELVKVMSELDEKVKVKFYGSDKPIVLECGTATQKARGLLQGLRE